MTNRIPEFPAALILRTAADDLRKEGEPTTTGLHGHLADALDAAAEEVDGAVQAQREWTPMSFTLDDALGNAYDPDLLRALLTLAAAITTEEAGS